MAKNLGLHKAMIMRNHGLLSVGDTMAQAFGTMRRLHEACEIQVMAQAGGAALRVPSPETCEHAARQFDKISGLNETAWAAELRMLDGIEPSFRD